MRFWFPLTCLNVRACKDLQGNIVLPHFADGETEAQRGHTESGLNLGFQSRFSYPQHSPWTLLLIGRSSSWLAGDGKRRLVGQTDGDHLALACCPNTLWPAEAPQQLILHQLPSESCSSWLVAPVPPEFFPCSSGRPALIRGVIKLGTNSENEILSDLAEPINTGLCLWLQGTLWSWFLKRLGHNKEGNAQGQPAALPGRGAAVAGGAFPGLEPSPQASFCIVTGMFSALRKAHLLRSSWIHFMLLMLTPQCTSITTFRGNFAGSLLVLNAGSKSKALWGFLKENTYSSSAWALQEWAPGVCVCVCSCVRSCVHVGAHVCTWVLMFVRGREH